MFVRYLLFFFFTLILACKSEKAAGPIPPIGPVAEISVRNQISNNLAKVDSLSEFTKYLKTASIPEEIKAVTILAPKNELFKGYAFNKTLPDGSSVEDYIIKGKIDLSKVSGDQIVMTVNNKQLTLHSASGNIYVNGILASTIASSTGDNFNVYPITTLLNTPKEYIDPKAEEYFIEFTDNGKYTLVKNTIKPWQFFSPQEWQPLISEGGACGVKVNYYFVENPGLQTTTKEFNWSLLRASGSTLPEIGEYNNENKKGRLEINGAAADCNSARSYYKFTINDVKVLSDLGLEKKGYYSGEFEGILYSGSLGTEPVEHIIRNGKFLLPIGGKNPVSLKGKGNAPAAEDKAKLLTKDKWYLISIYHQADNTIQYLDKNNLLPCHLDDFLRFSPEGIYTFDNGSIKCADDGSIDKGIWTMDKNATKIIFEESGTSTTTAEILELSSTILTLKADLYEGVGVVGTKYYFIQTYKHIR